MYSLSVMKQSSAVHTHIPGRFPNNSEYELQIVFGTAAM